MTASSASALPTPGQLIVENVVLLSGSPTAFQERYGHILTPTTFAKPGSTRPAHAVLHLLLCVIDGDVALALFKPCFPILDREQERDFRRVVDARLAVLEKTKLLPVGSARKSVVASAGGDRFIDLLWSLSSLAVQQACLRHPAYGPVSRLRLISHQVRADSSLSHQSSLRSNRSLVSVSSSRPDRSDPSRHRRFLGAGMATGADQQAKDVEEMRARISAERAALARTVEMGAQGAKTWGSEADSLREKIGTFEAKVRRLKGQLADMGFDENGNDIRRKLPQQGDADSLGDSSCARLSTSASREDLGDELKTSPIESMESGSSVDEIPEPGEGCDDIAADLSRLLAFSAETRIARGEIERSLPADKAVVISVGSGSKEKGELEMAQSRNPEDIVDLVRAATDELEQATSRMDEIKEAKRKADLAGSDIESGEVSPHVSKNERLEAGSLSKKLVESALVSHKNVVESSRKLKKAATQLTDTSRKESKKLLHSDTDCASRSSNTVANISKPTWLKEANVEASMTPLADPSRALRAGGSRVHPRAVNTGRDVNLAVQAVHHASRKSPRSAAGASSGSSSSSSSSSARRKKESFQVLSERRHVRTASSSSCKASSEAFCTPSSELMSKTPRIVRFAALPPSYSGNRMGDAEGATARSRTSRCTTEIFPIASRNVSRAAQRALPDDEVVNDVTKLPASEEAASKDTLCKEPVKKSSEQRRTGKRDAVRKDSIAAAKPMSHRRTASADSRLESARSHNRPQTKGGTLTRKQTPRRIARRKDAIQRAASTASELSVQGSSSAEMQPSSHIVQDRGDSSSVPTCVVEKVSDSVAIESQESSLRPEVRGSASKELSKPEGTPLVAGEVPSEDKGPTEASAAAEEQGSSDGESASTDHSATIPKRLFLTPDPLSSASVTCRSAPSTPLPAVQSSSAPASKKRAETKSNSHAGSGKSSTRKFVSGVLRRDTTPATSTLSATISALPRHNTEREGVCSPRATDEPSCELLPRSRGGKGDGFFAGQTAQWQQNVRTRSNLGTQPGDGSSLSTPAISMDSVATGMSSNGRNSGSSPPGKKSRVQSLKARLAAALK